MSVIKRSHSSTDNILEEEPPAKKIKCVLKFGLTANETFLYKLQTATSSGDILQLLIHTSESLKYEEIHAEETVEKLGVIFRKESVEIKMVILSIFVDISSTLGTNNKLARTIVVMILDLISEEKSHKVLAKALWTLFQSSKILSDEALSWKLIERAKINLYDTNHAVKCKCINILGELLPMSASKEEREEIFDLLSSYFKSVDSRTRAAALQNMLTLHQRGFQADSSIYWNVCEALKDDYENVRMASLRLMCALGVSYPDKMVRSFTDNQEVRLVDDVFRNICDTITEVSMRLRQEAAVLLGNLVSVSLSVLMLTLDKGLMSDLRKKKSAHERAIESASVGQWTKGKIWTSDRPHERLDRDKISVMRCGALGAFAQALEDDFLEVRIACIESIRCLGAHHAKFAAAAMDFLVEMFTDDIHIVRLKAIDSLYQISTHVEFREDQLDIVLGLLEDSSMNVREGLHRILASCRFGTKTCLQMCVNQLLAGLKKYPEDRKSIWNCFHKMGAVHSTLTFTLVPELLSIHPFFDTSEPCVEDPAYVSVLLLILNAAQCCPMISPLLEEKTIEHYAYLRDTMPHLVPFLPLLGHGGGDATAENRVESAKAGPTTPTRKFVASVLGRIRHAGHAAVRDSLMEAAVRDLGKIAEMDEGVAGCAVFNSIAISSQLLLGKLLKNKMWCYAAAAEHQRAFFASSLEKLLGNVFKMSYMFSGLSDLDLAMVWNLKLKILAVLCVYVAKATNHSSLPICHHIMDKVQETHKILNKIGCESDAFTAGLLRDFAGLNEDWKENSVATILKENLDVLNCQSLPEPNTNIKMCKAVINSPTGGPDVLYKFVASLAMSVPIDAEISHLHTTELLRLKLKYPDKQTHLIVPRSEHLRSSLSPDSSDTCRLVTTALISHQVWSQPSYVEMNLAFDISDQEAVACHAMQHLNPSNKLCVLDLCKPVKLYVQPKPVRR